MKSPAWKDQFHGLELWPPLWYEDNRSSCSQRPCHGSAFRETLSSLWSEGVPSVVSCLWKQGRERWGCLLIQWLKLSSSLWGPQATLGETLLWSESKSHFMKGHNNRVQCPDPRLSRQPLRVLSCPGPGSLPNTVGATASSPRSPPHGSFRLKCKSWEMKQDDHWKCQSACSVSIGTWIWSQHCTAPQHCQMLTPETRSTTGSHQHLLALSHDWASPGVTYGSSEHCLEASPNFKNEVAALWASLDSLCLLLLLLVVVFLSIETIEMGRVTCRTR